MKITDKGLAQILSLGLMRPTKSPGVYYLYTWGSLDYFCGLKISRKAFGLPGVYINLTDQQFSSLPIADHKSSKDPQLKRIAEYFETAAFLKYDQLNNSLRVSDYSSHNNKVSLLQIDMGKPSPFTIAKETANQFHGFFSPLNPCKESLQQVFPNTEKLWISASPIFEGKTFIGVIAGFTIDKEYGLDVLDVLKEFKHPAA